MKTGVSGRPAASRSTHLEQTVTSSRILATLAGVLISSSALAVDIFAVPRAVGDWSDPAIWQGGAVPGPNDVGFLSSFSNVTVDANAAASIGGFDSNATTVTLGRPVTFGGIGLRESFLVDAGFDLVVTDILSNSGHLGGGSFNGGTLVRQGGVFDVGHLDLGRLTNDFTFRPGDVIRRHLTTTRLFSAWPDISVVQDEVFYADNLGEGLSFEDPAGTISLGSTNAGDQSSITLSWDADLTGDIDWTLRWRGDHVAQMQAWYSNGQIIIGATPGGLVFDPSEHIFYDAVSDYTYVGFFSTDGDGVCQPSDMRDLDGDGYADECAPLGFSGLFPARAGEDNGFVGWDLTPGLRYAVVVSQSAGSTPLPMCPGLAVDMGSARVWMFGNAQPGGVDVRVSRLPSFLSGADLYVQIVEINTCRMSDVVVHAL